MDLDQLKQILVLVREHGLSEFELEDGGWRLKLRIGAALGQASPVPPAHTHAGAVLVHQQAVGPAAVAHTLPADVAMARDLPSAELDIELTIVKSPIVGTFYRSAEPGGPFFVDVGSPVKKGQVLCIIEAMKLMNEIDSECDGEVAKVYVENGQPVQYGERLFAIKTA